MDRVVRQYCAQVGRHLQCMPKTKKFLLAGLREELEQLPGERRSSLSRLEENYRSTIHTAIELQEAVKPEEQKMASRRKMRRTSLGVTAAILIVAVSTVLACKFSNLYWELREKVAPVPVMVEYEIYDDTESIYRYSVDLYP